MAEILIDYFSNKNQISPQDKEILNQNRGTGFAPSSKIYYIKGFETTLDSNGNGLWNNKTYINGAVNNLTSSNIVSKPSLNSNPSVISKKYDRILNKVFVNDYIQPLYSGFISVCEGGPNTNQFGGTYFIRGISTTLNASGTGCWTNNAGENIFYYEEKVLKVHSNIGFLFEEGSFIFFEISNLKDLQNIVISKLDDFNGFLPESEVVEGIYIDYFFDLKNKKLVKERIFQDGIFFIKNTPTTLDRNGFGYWSNNNEKTTGLNGWFFRGKLLYPDSLSFSGWSPKFNVSFRGGSFVNLNELGMGVYKEKLYINNSYYPFLQIKPSIGYHSLNFFEEEKFTGWATINEGAFDSYQYYLDEEENSIKFHQMGGTFYLNGVKTSLTPTGSGVIIHPESLKGVYLNHSQKTNLDINFGGVFEGKKYKACGVFDSKFTGMFQEKYFINGILTTLNSNGTGVYKKGLYERGKINKFYTGFIPISAGANDTLAYDGNFYGGTFYFKGTPTTLNIVGSGVFEFKEKLTYFLKGRPTTLHASLDKHIVVKFNKKTGSFESSGFGFGVWDDKTGEKIYMPPTVLDRNIKNVNLLIPTPVINKKKINGFISEKYGASNFSQSNPMGGCWYIAGEKTPLNSKGEGFWSVENFGKMNKIQNNTDLGMLRHINLLLGTYYVSFISNEGSEANTFAIPTDSLDESGSGYWRHFLFDSPFWINGKNEKNITGWISSLAGAPNTGTLNPNYPCKKIDVYNSLISNLPGSFFQDGLLQNVNSWPGYLEHSS